MGQTGSSIQPANVPLTMTIDSPPTITIIKHEHRQKPEPLPPPIKCDNLHIVKIHDDINEIDTRTKPRKSDSFTDVNVNDDV